MNSEVYVQPCAAGVAVSRDGQKLVVANYYNDSITVFTGGLGNWDAAEHLNGREPAIEPGELDLRPGKAASSPLPGTPGGEYPFWVVIAQPTPAGGQHDDHLGVCLQPSRPRDRRGESGRRDAGGDSPDPRERPTEQDDA